MKKFLKILLILVLVILLGVGGLLGWLTATEFDPASIEAVDVVRAGDVDTIKAGEELRVLSWNVGYAGLGKAEDFFMDGGTRSKPDSRDTVMRYLDGISASIETTGADLVLLQEVDINSSRTYSIDERGFLGGGNHLYSALGAHGIAFAGGSHNEGSHATTGHIVNNTFYGKGVDTSILAYRSHHGHYHAMVFLHFLHSVFLIC